MSVSFNNSGSTYLMEAGLPVTTTPLSVGMWVRPASVSGLFVPFLFYASAAPGAYQFYMYLNGDEFGAGAAGPSGNPDNGFGAAGVVAGAWYFLLARWISNTSRRYAVLYPNGTMLTLNQPGNTGTVTVDTLTLGGTYPTSPQPWSGDIAEYWVTSGDIWPSGQDMPAHTLHWLAYNGPFSMPHIAGAVREYKPLLQGGPDSYAAWENYTAGARPTWTAAGPPLMGYPHPPLAPGYPRPSDVRIVA